MVEAFGGLMQEKSGLLGSASLYVVARVLEESIGAFEPLVIIALRFLQAYAGASGYGSASG